MARDFYADMAIGMTPRNQVSAQQLVDQNLGENFVNSAVGFGKGLYGNKLF